MKLKKTLLALSSVVMLAACSNNSISKEDAVKRADQVAKKLAAGEVKFSDVVTMNIKAEAMGEKEDATYAMNATEKYYHMSDAEGDIYLYVDGDSRYLALKAKDEEKGTYALLSEEEFEGYIAEYDFDITSHCADFCDQLSSYLGKDWVKSAGIDLEASVQGLTWKKKEISENYTSTGEGNLGINVKIDVASEMAKVETAVYFAFTASIDNYIPKNLDATIKLATGAESYEMTGKLDFDWGKCNIVKPDLTNWTQTSI